MKMIIFQYSSSCRMLYWNKMKHTSALLTVHIPVSNVSKFITFFYKICALPRLSSSICICWYKSNHAEEMHIYVISRSKLRNDSIDSKKWIVESTLFVSEHFSPRSAYLHWSHAECARTVRDFRMNNPSGVPLGRWAVGPLDHCAMCCPPPAVLVGTPSIWAFSLNLP